ncbi:MAG: hypothetical protein Q8K89_10440 [Actinomycetota bacterium]|nr:hypothetical protein [Actinomycetota bacterium]
MTHKRRHAAPGSTADTAPPYRECPECSFISAEPGFASGTKRCPHCFAAGDSRRSFPAERIRRIDERIRHYHGEGEHEVVVILVATFLETLLEDMLARIMAAEGASVKLRAGVLDTQRSVGQRIGKLFPTLTGEQFEDAAKKAGLAEFPKRWRRLRAERNAFIHDAAFEGERESLSIETAAEALDLLDNAYALFMHMNNRFVAGEKRRRSSDASLG